MVEVQWPLEKKSADYFVTGQRTSKAESYMKVMMYKFKYYNYFIARDG
jgi:hypothetical protein